MRAKENYSPFTTVAFGLTLAIVVTFQLFIWREPVRIQADKQADHALSVASGGALYADNCAACHGDTGEGGTGPALNSKLLLDMVSDEALFNLTKTGIPGTIMPAWGQFFGGPFTDEQVMQMVTFVRAWQPTAPVIEPETVSPDPVRGATIYAQTCAICHGASGQGTELGPRLNDPVRLQSLEDSWYRSTIARGRPAKGMPTWGTVLSPLQISDLVALVAAWREGDVVSANIPLATYVTNAIFSLREFDQPDTIFFLNAALVVADADQQPDILAIISLVEANRLFEAERQLVAFLPPEEMGKAVYSSNCAPCHGTDGSGGIGSNLLGNRFVQSQTDEELVTFFLLGRSGTAMDTFEGILTADELINVAILLRSWQE